MNLQRPNNSVYGGHSLQSMEIFRAPSGTSRPAPLDGHDKIDLGNDSHRIEEMTFQRFDFDNTSSAIDFTFCESQRPHRVQHSAIAVRRESPSAGLRKRFNPLPP